MGRLLAGIVAVAIGLLATPGLAQEKLTIWWAKGFYKAEDDALLAVVKKYEAKTGVKVELTWHAAQEMIPKVTAALEAGTPPDIAYADAFNLQTAGRWAFEGKLDDISDVIAPIKDRFAPNTVEAAYLASGKTGKKAYYAFPLKQQTLHIQYWKDILAAAGFKENDIPYTWKEYWAFWCDKVQPAFRASAGPAVFGVGSPMGIEFDELLQVVPGLGRCLRRQAGRRCRQVLVGDAKVRQGLDRRAQGLHRSLREGLHAASVDRLEGWRQRPRLQWPDRRHDAQRRRSRSWASGSTMPTTTSSAPSSARRGARPTTS